MPVEHGLARKKAGKHAVLGKLRLTHLSDRFEQQDIAFHQRVREGYLRLAAAEPERWLVIDATKSKEEIAEIIWQRVRGLISGRLKETES